MKGEHGKVVREKKNLPLCFPDDDGNIYTRLYSVSELFKYRISSLSPFRFRGIIAYIFFFSLSLSLYMCIDPTDTGEAPPIEGSRLTVSPI